MNQTKIIARVIPKARENRIEDISSFDPNTKIVKIWVTAAPKDGEANRSMCDLIAHHFRIPISSVKIIKGFKNRNKLLLIN